MSIRIAETDLNLPEDRAAVLAMVDAYSLDAMGSAKPLDPEVRARLIPRVAEASHDVDLSRFRR